MVAAASPTTPSLATERREYLVDMGEPPKVAAP
jgi:hypothetical protein